MRPPTYDQLREYRLTRGLPWFTAKWDLNLFIIRSGKVGFWDDLTIAACLDDHGREVVLVNRCTGDAWEGEWLNPTHQSGCVYVLDGHYQGGYKLGLHKGRDALVQVKNFHNVRWPPDKGYVPTVRELEEHAAEGNSFWDVRGTNLHNRWNYSAPGVPQPNDSEGCVVTLYRHAHAALIELVKTQKDQRGADTVSPTFCRRKDFIGL